METKSAKHAWMACVGCMMVVFITIGLANSSFSVFQPFFISQRGLTNSQASSLILVRNIFSILTAIIVVPFYKKISYRQGLFFSAILVGVGYLIYGFVTNFAGVIIGSACCGIAHTLGGMVAISVMIGRWFKVRNGFALGICLAASGLASIILPPVATFLIESRGLSFALTSVGVFIFALAVVTTFLIKDEPDENKGFYALTAENSKIKEDEKNGKEFHREVSRKGLILAVIAFICVGGIANAGYAHYSVLYTKAGFSSFQVSMLLSVLGLTVMLGKIVFGVITDHFGTIKANYFAFTVLIAGTIICCFAGHFSYPVAVLSMVLAGFGVPMSTNGISMASRQLSSEKTYASTVNCLNVSFQIGAIIFSEIPGMVADATGSYAPSYILFVFTGVVALVLIQTVIQKNLQMEKREKESLVAQIN